LPIIPRQLDFSSDYIIRTDGETGWALYDNIQPNCPILQFDFASREIYPGSDVTYNHKECVKERQKNIEFKATKLSEDFIRKTTTQTAKELNKNLMQKGPINNRRFKIKNMFEHIYVPEDTEELDEELQRIEKERQKFIDGQFLDHLSRTNNQDTFSANWEDINLKTEMFIRNKPNFKSNWLETYLTKLSCELVESNILTDMSRTHFGKLRVMREILEKVKKYEPRSEVSLTLCSCDSKENNQVVGCLPVKIKEFINKDNTYWFGFKKNKSLNNLLSVCNIRNDILDIKGTEYIHDSDAYMRIYNALRKLCAVTRSKQFIAFCHCYKGDKIIYGISDKRLSKTLQSLAPGIMLSAFSMIELISDFTKMIKNRRFFYKLLNEADLWIKNFKISQRDVNYFSLE